VKPGIVNFVKKGILKLVRKTQNLETKYELTKYEFMIYFILALFLWLLTPFTTQPRNPRRAFDPLVPTITVCASDPQQEKTWASRRSSYDPVQTGCTLKSNFLRLKPLKCGFDEEFFKQHYLPNEIITYRDRSGVVHGSTLSKLASELIEEIKVGQRKFTHFTILKDKDFNYKTLSGLIVLRYNDYPFVIKVSIEHPHTVVQPYSKSNEAGGMFISGGNLRHLSNFTRIMNLHRIKQILSYNPFYLHSIGFPCKWYWKPENEYNLKIHWVCNGQSETIYLPSIYATISDFIYTEEHQPQHELNKLSMRVATDVNFLIDPHAGNIQIEKGTRKYILLDTEDFRLMTGLNTTMKAKKYIGWFVELVTNAAHTLLLRSKKERLEQSTLI